MDQQNPFCLTINPFQNKPLFLCVCSTNLLKILWERRNCSSPAISPFPSHVFPFEEILANFIKFKIVLCKLLQFGRLKFVVWQRVNPFPHNDTF